MDSQPPARGEHVSQLVHDMAPGHHASSDDVALVASMLADEHKGFVDRHRRAVLAFEESIDRHLAERSDLIGEETLRSLRAFSEKQRSSSYGLTDFRPGRFDPDKLRAAKRDAQQSSREMIASAGVDTEALQRINDQTISRNRDISEGIFERAPRLQIAAVDDAVQALQGSGDSFIKTPPFDDTSLWYSYHRWGGALDYASRNEIVHDPFRYVTGKLGHDSEYRNKDASDFDGLFFTMKTRVGFWYTAPAEGPRQIWIKMRVHTSRADVWLEDEWGYSESHHNFLSRFEINISQIQGIQGATEDFVTTVGGAPGDGTWTTKPLIVDNAEVWIPFMVDLPPGAVFIWIIANDHRSILLNDVSTVSRMRTRYEVEEVHIG